MEQSEKKHAGGRPKKRKVIVEPMLDSFYTVAEVSQMLKVHPNTVRSMIKSGELQAEKVGLGYRISRSSLEERFQCSF